MLGHRKYRLREDATKKLIGYGLHAEPQLRKALESTDLEIATRARKVLDAISPQRGGEPMILARIEAAILLGLIGSRKSIPALRHALNEGPAALSTHAASALRCILHGGPSADIARWEKNRNGMLATWATHLDKRSPIPTGQSVKLTPRLPRGLKWVGRTRTDLVLRIDWASLVSAKLRLQRPITRHKMLTRLKERSVYRAKAIRSEPPILSMSFTEHQSSMSETLGEQRIKEPQVLRFKGNTMVLEARKGDMFQCTMNDKPMSVNFEGPVGQLGAMIGLRLPSGSYRPGQSRPLSGEFFQWVNKLLFAHSKQKLNLIQQAGRLTYLGRTGGVERYFLVCHLAEREQMREVTRISLNGELWIDPKHGVVTRYDLSGPIYHSVGGGKKPMRGDGHWETHYSSTWIVEKQQPVERRKDKK